MMGVRARPLSATALKARSITGPRRSNMRSRIRRNPKGLFETVASKSRRISMICPLHPALKLAGSTRKGSPAVSVGALTSTSGSPSTNSARVTTTQEPSRIRAMAGKAPASCARCCQSSRIMLLRKLAARAQAINCAGLTSTLPSRLSWTSCSMLRFRPKCRPIMTRHPRPLAGIGPPNETSGPETGANAALIPILTVCAIFAPRS